MLGDPATYQVGATLAIPATSAVRAKVWDEVGTPVWEPFATLWNPVRESIAASLDIP